MFPHPEHEYTVMVVTLAYNHASYIEDTLKGILMQQVDFPIVACVLDDCSTDGTADIVRKYEAQYPDIIKGFYFEENQFSQGKFTFEVLIPWLSKVKYIALCEGDDFWTDPLKLQKQVDFMESHRDCTLCFHNALIDRENSSTEPQLENSMGTREYYPYEFFEKWIITTASILFRSNVLNHSETMSYMTDKRFVQYDVILWLSCASLGKVVGFKDVMSVHRILKSGHTISFSSNLFKLIDINYRYCIHNKTLLEIFGRKFGTRFTDVIQKYLIEYGRYGLTLSFVKLNLGYIKKFIKLLSFESPFQILISILYVPKLIMDYLYRTYCVKHLSALKRRIIRH